MPKTLILVPTDLERRGLFRSLATSSQIALCGFGPVAAAARTAGLLAQHSPDRVVLVGIAGRLDGLLNVGDAYQFAEVGCLGVGAGSGERFISAGAMGWPQWPGDPPSPEATIGDVLPLTVVVAAPSSGQLLTACAAAASDQDVTHRRSRFPNAVAEDMEGFGVAMACRLAGTPLTIIRGISNAAGDRDASRWQIIAALDAAAAVAQTILEATW